MQSTPTSGETELQRKKATGVRRNLEGVCPVGDETFVCFRLFRASSSHSYGSAEVREVWGSGGVVFRNICVDICPLKGCWAFGAMGSKLGEVEERLERLERLGWMGRAHTAHL